MVPGLYLGLIEYMPLQFLAIWEMPLQILTFEKRHYNSIYISYMPFLHLNIHIGPCILVFLVVHTYTYGLTTQLESGGWRGHTWPEKNMNLRHSYKNYPIYSTRFKWISHTYRIQMAILCINRSRFIYGSNGHHIHTLFQILVGSTWIRSFTFKVTSYNTSTHQKKLKHPTCIRKIQQAAVWIGRATQLNLILVESTCICV